MSHEDLNAAISAGDLEAVRALLEAGADVRYARPHGYTALIDAMYGRVIADNSQLLPILRLLIDRGADLDAVSDHGESALRVAANVGRFDAVGLLLDAGADPAPLGWTPQMRAVALGSIEDVRRRIGMGDDLTARDCWKRTAWLLSLQVGDVARSRLLLEAGADPSDRGHCGKTPLMYAIEGDREAMLEWLLGLGMDPDEPNEFGTTPLGEAAEYGATGCVRRLLEAGADVHRVSHVETPIKAAANLEVVRLLCRAGADLHEINDAMRAALTRQPHDGSLACTPAEYQQARHRTFGNANPQPMDFPFWKAMIAGGADAYQARFHFEPEGSHGEAVWCFQRFGQSITELPDGRIIEVGGEHEDYYDEDFCIYNDVVVHHGDGTFSVYGYPTAVLPPTDFHSATLVGRWLYLIGSLGYQGERAIGTTPVYRLDVDTLAIEPVATTGEPPGWISSHRARFAGGGIEVSGGKVSTRKAYQENPDVYRLDLTTLAWSRLPNWA